MDSTQHFATLFSQLEAEFGKLDPTTLTSIVGFSAGGPVSLRQVARQHLFVTCELSLYAEQRVSSERLKFELLYRGRVGGEDCQKLLTALGNLSFHAQLGDGHTIDVSQVVPPSIARTVLLRLHSQCRMPNGNFGVYEVLPGE